MTHPAATATSLLPPAAVGGSWIRTLQTQLSEGALAVDLPTLQAHAGDAWFAKNLPQAVAFPKTAEEVSTILRICNDRKVPVTARGAGRGYVGGCVPSRAGVVVSFAKMNKILDVNEVDSVAVVQPGVITGEFQDHVLGMGLFYPPDPASLKECSIGGNVSTNAGGPRCLKYGVTRNYILGMQVALADGTLVRVGGRTQKNKSGFDFVGLFVGSEGLLGIVTEITVRLIPAPPSRAVLAASFATAPAAAACVQQIFKRGFLPSALEMADHFTLKAARKHLGENALPPGDAHLLIEIDGQKDSVESEVKTLASVLGSQGAISVSTGHTEEACTNLWNLRRQFSASLKAQGLTKLNEDVCVPRSHLVDLFNLAEKLQAKYGFEVACFGHAGDGNIHVNIMVDMTQEGARDKSEQALDELFAQVIDWGGAITGEHGIGLAKKKWWPLAASPELRKLHQTVKQALDPDRILNPGKFV